MIKQTKKDVILTLYRRGIRNVDRLASAAGTRQSYVASVLQDAGKLQGYNDLYTTTGQETNAYSKYFRGVLSFKTVDSARQSVARIGQLYEYFERIGDRAGQHHAEVVALTGRNRARWSGKKDEAAIFLEWLVNH